MANIDGLFGFNRSDGTNKLLACYGNDIVDVEAGTGYSQNITAGQSSSWAVYLDYLLFQNGTDTPRSFNGSAWSTAGVRNHFPLGKYLKTYIDEKVYIANVTIAGTAYPSIVLHSAVPYNNDIRWEIEWGTNLQQWAGNTEVNSANAGFKVYGIKAGDPLYILTGANAGEYTVSTVMNDTQLRLTEKMENTASNSTFWVGSNFFRVKTDDNDYIRGIGENSNRLLFFKLNSLHRYDGSTLRQVKGAPGTSSAASIINLKDFTLYFHGSSGDKTGIYIYNGVSSQRATNAIQPYIDGISANNFPNVVAWPEGTWYRIYVGTITNSQRNISIDNAVISYNVADNTLSVDPINKVIKNATTWIDSNAEKTFIGTSTDEIFETPSGYNFDGSAIPFVVETGVYYPWVGKKDERALSTEMMKRFSRIQVVGRDCRGIKVRYKLVNKIGGNSDTQWQGLGELKADKTEITIPTQHNQACGVNIRFEEISTRENAALIEKLTIFFTVEGTYI